MPAVKDELKLHDVVALLEDLPEHGLKRGDVGTVVEVFGETGHHPAGYIVEFVAASGAVYAQADFTDPARLIKLNFSLRHAA